MKKHKTLFWVCLFAVLFMPAGIDLYVGLIPHLTTLYGQSAELGLSVYVLGSGLGAVLCGPAYDKWGGRRLLQVCSGLLMLAILIGLLSQGFTSLLVSRFAQGVAVAGFSLAALSMIKDNFDDDQVPSLYGKANGFMNVAPALFPAISIALLSFTGTWHSAFVFYLLLTVLFVAVLSVKVKPDALHWQPTERVAVWRVLANVPFLLWALMPALSLGLIFMYCGFYATLLTEQYGLDLVWFSGLFAANGVLMFLTGQGLGPLFAKYGPQGVFKAGLQLALVSALLVASSGLSPWLSLVGISGYCVAFIMIISSSHALALSKVTSGIGTANGVISVLQMSTGSALVAALVYIAPEHVAYAFALGVVSLVVLGGCALRFGKGVSKR